MTTEDLLKPRYKVKADYPGSPFKIGQILVLNEFSSDQYWHKHTPEEPIHLDQDEDGETKYPAIFLPIAWHHERSIEDMPEYLLFIDESGTVEFVLKVEKYIFHNDSTIIWAFEYFGMNEPGIKRMSLSGWLPSSNSEYLEFWARQITETPHQN